MALDSPEEELPPFASSRDILAKHKASLVPSRRQTITDAAEDGLKVNVAGQWSNFSRDVTPYMTEPTDIINSRRFRGMSFCGPSQSGKTQMLLSAAYYATQVEPMRAAIFQMTKDAAKDFERDKLAPTIANTEKMKDSQLLNRGTDVIFEKVFRGDARLTLNWPTITQLSSQTIRWLLLTDYDHFPEVIGGDKNGEGDGYSLARARAKTFQSRGMVACESSPGAVIIDAAWRQKEPHEAPPVRYGVLSLYNTGTRGRWYWPCPRCEEIFEPTFSKIKYDMSSEEGAESARMVCPHCREKIKPGMKSELNRAGYWLHVGKGGDLVRMESGDVRNVDCATYWLNGAAAAFSTWSELAAQYESAKTLFEKTKNDRPLRTVTNTGFGMPYLPRRVIGEGEITVEALEEKQEDAMRQSVAPAWTQFITIAVDSQGSRWDVMVMAWGKNGERAPIDRFDIHEPPADAPRAEDRVIAPGKYPEDWKALEGLLTTVWPIEGSRYGLTAVAMGVDMQGAENTTENARRWYRKMRKEGLSRYIYLIRGRPGVHQSQVWFAAPTSSNKNKAVASDVKILNVATDSLKASVAAALLREDTGSDYYHIPKWYSSDHLLEFAAEEIDERGRWDKKPGVVRNESLDLSVYNSAVYLQLQADKVDWQESPLPRWVDISEKNPFVVLLDRSEDSVQKPQTKLQAKKPIKRPKQIGYLKRR